jgi:CheY-like chemotaxis protein
MHGEFTILVAEDEDSNYALIDAILKPRAIKIIRALNGREAVDLCRQHEKIDLILMDIKMPEMGGLEATREILRFKPRLPIVAQSAYAHPADIEKASLAGCSGYLAKPFNRKQLLEIIEKHLPKK